MTVPWSRSSAHRICPRRVIAATEWGRAPRRACRTAPAGASASATPPAVRAAQERAAQERAAQERAALVRAAQELAALALAALALAAREEQE
jgi:hypothetical protein